jgi:hypothetical protein
MSETWKIRTVVRVYYEHEVEADTIQEAVAMVEDGESDGVEYDSCAPSVEYVTTPGVMGWDNWKAEGDE